MDPEQSRQAIETILDRPRNLNERGKNVEILTVDNHCDGAFLQQKIERENHPCANQVREILKWNVGARYSSEVGISNIDFNGNVHADQFSMFRSFGDVQRRPFSEFWQDTSNQIMAGMKEHHGQSKNWKRYEMGFAV